MSWVPAQSCREGTQSQYISGLMDNRSSSFSVAPFQILFEVTKGLSEKRIP